MCVNCEKLSSLKTELVVAEEKLEKLASDFNEAKKVCLDNEADFEAYETCFIKIGCELDGQRSIVKELEVVIEDVQQSIESAHATPNTLKRYWMTGDCREACTDLGYHASAEEAAEKYGVDIEYVVQADNATEASR